MPDLTLGSLFDGSGGFPLGAALCSITPLWASEIEPFPIRVTTKRLPSLQHLGDTHKIDGGKIPPVDIITFGSPCTNLSLAGRREGLSGKQSVLFYQAIRIIQEMRDASNGMYPEPTVQAKGRISAQSSNPSPKLKTKPYLFLCLKKANGSQRGKSWETIFPSPGAPLTRNTSESPRDAAVVTLSRILEENAPEKYYLSVKAYLGILRRAASRGKDLPKILKRALEAQSGLSREPLQG
jgi:hypothetical protein